MIIIKRSIILALDLGYSLNGDTLSSIDDLALATLNATYRYEDCIVLAQEKIYEQLARISSHDFVMFKLETGQSTSVSTNSGGTWQALVMAKSILDQYDLGYDVILIAHKLHFRRAQNQAKKLNINVMPAHDVALPYRCYAAAEQWWCRNPFSWHLRELIGYFPLKLKGQLWGCPFFL